MILLGDQGRESRGLLHTPLLELARHEHGTGASRRIGWGWLVDIGQAVEIYVGKEIRRSWASWHQRANRVRELRCGRYQDGIIDCRNQDRYKDHFHEHGGVFEKTDVEELTLQVN